MPDLNSPNGNHKKIMKSYEHIFKEKNTWAQLTYKYNNGALISLCACKTSQKSVNTHILDVCWYLKAF